MVAPGSVELLVGFRLVVLYAHRTPGSSSTHFNLAKCRRFFKVVKKVLLDDFAWLLLCEYSGVEYKFLIFISLQKFMYTLLSNCGPLLVIIDCGIPNQQTMFFYTNWTISLSLMEAKALASTHLLK